MALGLRSMIDVAPYRALLPASHYLRTTPDARFLEDFKTWLLVSFDDVGMILPDKSRVKPFDAMLNTAVAAGSDPIRLLSKLHGQCEIHAYVEGKNRAWLADVIEAGVRDRILRTWEGDYYGGWPAVAELLRRRDDEPVVTSYSVTDSFPNMHVARDAGKWQPVFTHEDIRKTLELTEGEDPADYEGDYLSDLWYEKLPASEQWEYAMRGLRKMSETAHLEIAPETLGTQGYGNGMSGFDIAHALAEEAERMSKQPTER